jgi:tetratricopeptide (TPR) repeat protein
MIVAACGGAARKEPTTTPEAKTQAGGYSAAKSGYGTGDDILPLEQKKAAEPPPPPPKDSLAPPGQDLPPEKREAMVRDELRRGVQALRANDSDGVIRAARAALDLDETSVEAMIMLAHGYYLKQYDDKVEAVLTLAQKQKAGQAHPVLWMLLGLVYDRTNREDQALAAYEKATQLKPDYLAALNNKGAIYLKRKRYADAIPVFEQIVQIDDASARGHTSLGAAYRGRSADMSGAQREQLLKRAEAELKLALSKDGNYAPAYFDIGVLYLDADPFPGLETLARLQLAQKNLSQYKQTAGPSGVAAVDDYLAAAQKGIEREQKAIERRKKKDAEKAKKGASK